MCFLIMKDLTLFVLVINNNVNLSSRSGIVRKSLGDHGSVTRRRPYTPSHRRVAHQIERSTSAGATRTTAVVLGSPLKRCNFKQRRRPT
jgi:hypothetical protein